MTQKRLDISSEPDSNNQRSRKHQGKPFLGVEFDCCGVYARIYLNQDGSAYEGRCPRCYKTVSIKVGSGGSSSRFFKAT